ncbi:Vms1/Ankzf1 family peptidyl-tRNA hydrolase [Nocardia sp. NPDC024068]|uniref:Rv2629 family ribosome hibernation factor n=1 Tax=Nocardia sp. NPDC024068 TaxID=3157197 RepID=UPI0033F75569
MTIRDVAKRPGPFASLYIDAEHDTEDAEHRRALQWRALAGQLAEQGATETMIDALGAAVTGSPPEPGHTGRALIADSGAVLIDRRLPEPPPRDTVRVSPLPYLLPLIESDAREVPHAVASVDKVGSEMYGVDAHGTVVGETVQGEGHPIHKVRHGGGWSHRSMQRRVEEKVERNTAEVAAELTRLAREIRAQVIVVSGEVTVRSAVRAALGSTGAQVVEVESDGGDLDAEVADIVATEAGHRHEEVVARYDKARGRAEGLAVSGLAPTVSALLAANTENLLINSAALGDRTVALDPEPLRDPAALGAPGEKTTWTCRADEALPVATLVRGATITPVDETAAPPEGVGALLRHA